MKHLREGKGSGGREVVERRVSGDGRFHDVLAPEALSGVGVVAGWDCNRVMCAGT